MEDDPSKLVYEIRWEKPLTQFDFATPFMQSILAQFPEKADIGIGPGRLLTVLFAFDSSHDALLTTDRLRTLKIPSETSIILRVGGSNFVAQTIGRFRISIRSWSDMSISEITVTSQLHDALRKLTSRLGTWFNGSGN